MQFIRAVFFGLTDHTCGGWLTGFFVVAPVRARACTAMRSSSSAAPSGASGLIRLPASEVSRPAVLRIRGKLRLVLAVVTQNLPGLLIRSSAADVRPTLAVHEAFARCMHAHTQDGQPAKKRLRTFALWAGAVRVRKFLQRRRQLRLPEPPPADLE